MAALDSAATAHAADSTVAGVAVVVVQRGDTLLHKGYGQADLEFDVPMPKDAIFEVGSITKQFTAAAILQLAAKDSINLDAPITEYLPDYNTRGHRVTPRHLLHHTSGIRSYTNMAQFQDIGYQDLPRDTLLTLVEAEPLRFAPGTAMSYSNSGYFLLGRMIEETSGQSYKSYLEEHLLGPAGMGDSYYCDEEAVVDHKAHGYWWSGKQGLRRKEYWDHTWLYSAGSLCSSVPDLVAWNRALHGGAVLPDSMYQQMTAPGRLADGTALRYGMGLAVPEDEGHPVIGHLGVVSGFLNASLYYPEGDLIIVALQNSRGPRAAWDLADEFARLAVGPRITRTAALRGQSLRARRSIRGARTGRSDDTSGPSDRWASLGLGSGERRQPRHAPSCFRTDVARRAQPLPTRKKALPVRPRWGPDHRTAAGQGVRPLRAPAHRRAVRDPASRIRMPPTLSLSQTGRLIAMTTARVAPLAVQHQLDAYNDRDLDAFREAYAPEVRIENGTGETMMEGTEELRAFYGTLFSNSPDGRCSRSTCFVAPLFHQTPDVMYIHRPSALALVASLLFFVCHGLVSPAAAQPDTTRWTPELSMRYDQITEAQISPDGDRVAYVVREAVMNETTSEFRQHIHVAAVDDSADVQYTRGEHSSFSPKWSPSGDRIAFFSARGGPPQVYLMRLHGGEAYAVTDAETGVSEFQWAPDGNRIAYTMTDPKSKAERQREKEKRDVNLVNQEFRYAHLYTTEVKPANDITRSVQRLTEGTFHVTSFDWAPDGDTIAFTHKPNPRVNSFMGSDLSAVPADSGAVEPLVERPGVDADLHYSPSGERIAFMSMGGTEAWEGLIDTWTVPADGGEPTALAQTPNRFVGGYGPGTVGWTAGGEGLLVRDVAGTSTRVYAVPADGDSARAVTSNEGVYEAVSYSRSADQLAFVYQNSESPPEVYVSGRENVSRRKVTDVNSGVPKPETGRTELVTWTAPDGTEIEGLLTYPVGYEGGRVPLILSVHGGPVGVHNRSFTGGLGFPPVQASAEHGYAVLRPNPRGSAGYGRSFRAAVLENWGPGPFRDLMAGVDWAIEMGVAHPDSLVITGGSYGGYMTAYAVTQTDRFEAASMVAGLSNLISHMGTTDVPNNSAAQMGGAFWDRRETYEKNSPIYHVKGVSTPTQVIHGAEDERVHPTQGREFYRALRRLGVPTEMVLYPRMPHAWPEPKLAIDLITRILDWFDEHLGRSSGDSSE